MMTEIEGIPEDYSSRLENYLSEQSEAALQRAYELGRKAIGEGLGALDIARIHQEAMQRAASRPLTNGQHVKIARLGTTFLIECLAPFEITHRGFREVIATLSVRAAELAEINKRLETEIAERVQAENALRESETRYRNIFENARDVLYSLSTNGRIISLNPAFEEITGWSRADWVGKHFEDILHPDDLSVADEVFHRLVRGEKPPRHELRVRTKSGDYKVGEFTSTPLVRDGAVVAILGIVRDITQRKRTDQQIKFHAGVLAQVNDAVVTVDNEERVTYWNRAAEMMCGIRSEEIIGRKVSEVIDWHWLAPHDEHDSRDALAQTGTWKGETITVRKDGTQIYVESTVSVLKDERGTSTGYLAVGRDITERKRNEEALKRHKAQLSEAQRLAHLASWEWDIATNKVTWSDELYRIFGLQPQEFQATYEGYLAHVHPEDREYVNGIIERALSEARPFTFEERVIRPNGVIRILYSEGEVVTDNRGKPIRMIGFCQDITERKEAEQALREVRKRVLEAQEVERRRVARELHDDVCQRLSAMKLHLEVLGSVIRATDQKALKRVRTIKRQLDLLFTDVRRISFNERPTALDDFGLATALRLFCAEFGKAHRMKVSFSADGTTERRSDEELEIALYRIAQEALTNAAKHSGASRAKVRLSLNRNAVRLTIEDDGKGFEPKLALARRREKQGLGLVNMKERAELLGGTFRIESVPTNGTRIEVEVPLQSS